MPVTYGGYAYASGEYAGPNAGNSPGSQLNGGLFPPLIIEIGFGSGALDEPVTWTDVSNWARSFTVHRGRQHELGRFEAGTVSLVLDNRDGRFSPFNTSSPYNPNVIPYVPVRIRGMWNGLTWPIFRGHIESWPVKWPTANESDVTVAAVDATKTLAMKKAVALSTYGATVISNTPYLYWRLGDAAGSATVADSSGNSRTGTVTSVAPSTGPYSFQLGTDGAIVADLDKAVDLGSTAGMISRTGISIDGREMTMEAWVNLRIQGAGVLFDVTDGANKIVTVLISRAGNVELVAIDSVNSVDIISNRQIVDGNWHHVVATIGGTGTIAAIYIDGVTDISGSATPGALNLTGLTAIGVGGSTGPNTPATDGRVDEVALYAVEVTQAILDHHTAGVNPLPSQLPGARIDALLDGISWPATLRSIDTGNSVLQAATNQVVTASVLENIQKTADTEAGQLFISGGGDIVFYDRNHTQTAPLSSVAIILGDSGTVAEEPYLSESVNLQFDDLDLYNEVIVTPDGQGPATASDSGSQTTYGKRTLSRSTLDASNTTAAARAAADLSRYKAPLQRVRGVSFTPMSDPQVLFPAALGFELLTRVRLIRRPKDGAGSTFDQTALIEGITHEVNAQDGSWKTTWALSPTDALAVTF